MNANPRVITYIIAHLSGVSPHRDSREFYRAIACSVPPLKASLLFNSLLLFFFQIVYATALFPYIVLTVLLIRGITLPNSSNGIIFLLKPQWHRLLEAEVGTYKVSSISIHGIPNKKRQQGTYNYVISIDTMQQNPLAPYVRV